MYQPLQQTVSIRLHCPTLIRGIIVMHQFGYQTDVDTPEKAKIAVLRFIAIMLGLTEAQGADLDMHEIFSHNSGATFAPEDTYNSLNIIYAAFKQIYTIDCTYTSLIITGEWDLESNLSIQDLQDVINSELEEKNLEYKFKPSYR